VKTALSILCSLGLLWAQMAGVQTTPVCAIHACCHCGGRMACCAQPLPARPPLTANLVFAGGQNQLSIPLPGVVVWLLPDVPAAQFSTSATASFAATASPLYARDCARLI
jgi:hypothetical protein